jgi:NTP pyrophosphatase (non-canonical NTP hydrolase)
MIETFAEYEKLAAVTMNKDLSHKEALVMLGLGVAGEAGEVADMIKKFVYHGHEFDDIRLIKEVGDVLWYLANLMQLRDISLGFVARKNIEKLSARYPNGFSHEASRNRSE